MNPRTPPPDRKIKAAELADLLNVSTVTIHRMTRTTDMPRLRIGRSVRFDKQSVLDWLAHGQHVTPETGREAA